jgi:hypothetical protein
LRRAHAAVSMSDAMLTQYLPKRSAGHIFIRRVKRSY